MLQEFKRIPGPLQKQMLLHLGLSVLFFLILVALLATDQDVLLWLPCAGMVLLFIVAAFTLFRQAVLEDYVVVQGECVEVGLTAVKRRAKYLILRANSSKVKVMLRDRTQKITVGSNICLYVSKNTPIYKDNNYQMLYTYIAMDAK